MSDMKEFLFNYSMNNRPHFNEDLFTRSEQDIIDDVESIILSAVKNDKCRGIRMSVNYFKVIDDYREIYKVLYDLENDHKRRNKRIKYNKYDYINLRDSDIVLLEVNYHLEVDGRIRDDSVYIQIPRVVEKYYFRINGTMYSSLYQIADTSTYNNNNASKKKDHSVSFRQTFLKFSIYQKFGKMNRITPEQKIEVTPCCSYMTDLFINSNLIPVCKYFLASYGLSDTMSFLHLEDVVISKTPVLRKDYVCFERGETYISTPLYYWNNSTIVQSFIYTLYVNIPKDGKVNLNDLYTREYWICLLGADFKAKTLEKGISILDSLDRNYDIKMRDSIRLPYDDKKDLVSILRWMICQFEDLYNKDNTDMSYKKLRISSYIAGFYATKLSYQLFKITNPGSKLTVDTLYNSLNIPYSYILDQLKRCNLLTYKNSVSDNDSLSVLKYTFKGISGIGEKKTSAVPKKYRMANASHLGKVDCDSSSASDPGMTGLMCPYAEVYDGGYLSDMKEPCNWREITDSMLSNYKKAINAVSLFQIQEQVTDIQNDDTRDAEFVAETISNIMDPFIKLDKEEQVIGSPLEESGTITYQ